MRTRTHKRTFSRQPQNADKKNQPTRNENAVNGMQCNELGVQKREKKHSTKIANTNKMLNASTY